MFASKGAHVSKQSHTSRISFQSESDNTETTPPTTVSSDYSSSQDRALIVRAPSRNYQSNADLLVELGRLRAQTSYQDEQIQSLERETAYYQRYQQAHNELVAYVRTLEADKSNLQVQLQSTKELAAKQDKRIKDLQDKLEKAQVTINVQSDQIRAPRDGRGIAKATSKALHGHPYHSGARNHQDVLQSRASSFDITGAASLSQPLSGWRQEQSSLFSSEESPVLRKLPSQESNPWDNGQDGTLALLDSSANLLSPHVSNGYSTLIGLKSEQSLTPSASHIQSQLTKFLMSVESWAKKYVNLPDQEYDVNIPLTVIDHINGDKDSPSFPNLLASTANRHLVLMKLLLRDCVEHAFRPTVVKGFNSEYDSQLYSLRRRIVTGMPADERRNILCAYAGTISKMTTDAKWDEYLNLTTSFRTKSTLQYIRYFLEPSTNSPTPSTRNMSPEQHTKQAYVELFRLWNKALRLGVLMLQRISMFSLDFPPVGNNSIYNPAVMKMIRSDELETASSISELRVRLAITPVITETICDGSTDMNPKVVCLGRVLVSRL